MYKINKKLYIIITAIIVIFNIITLSNPKLVIDSASNAITLWFNKVMPSLLPFIIFNNILKYTNGFTILGNFFKPFMYFLFGHKGLGGISFIAGITSGYPLGAKVLGDLVEDKAISRENANHLVSFVNNAGPLFILGTVGLTMFNSTQVGYFLLIVHIFSAVTNGIIFKKTYKPSHATKHTVYQNKINSHVNLLDVIAVSINDAMSTILSIGGFIIFFSVVATILNIMGITLMFTTVFKKILPFLDVYHLEGIFIGSLELTTGIHIIVQNSVNLKLDLVIVSGLLGFGGFSVHGQSISSLTRANLKVKNYLVGKLLHSILAMIYTFLFFDWFLENETISVASFISNAGYIDKFIFTNNPYIPYVSFFTPLLFLLLIKKSRVK